MSKQHPLPPNPLRLAWRALVNRLMQSPDVYPIKFYMKGSRRSRRYVYMTR